MLYLLNERDQEAMTLFRQLEDLADTESQFRAFGLAGEYCILVNQGKDKEAANAFASLFEVRDKLQHRLMDQIFERIVYANRTRLEETNANRLQQWLEERQATEEPQKKEPGTAVGEPAR